MALHHLAKALYDNVSDTKEELSFRKGDILTVIEIDTEMLQGWWLCKLHGITGIAPGNRLKMLAGVYQPLQDNEDYDVPRHVAGHTPQHDRHTPNADRHAPSPSRTTANSTGDSTQLTCDTTISAKGKFTPEFSKKGDDSGGEGGRGGGVGGADEEEQPLYNQPIARPPSPTNSQDSTLTRQPKQTNHLANNRNPLTTDSNRRSRQSTPTPAHATSTTPTSTPVQKRVTLDDQLIYNLPSSGPMSPKSDHPVPKSCLRKRLTASAHKPRPSGVTSPLNTPTTVICDTTRSPLNTTRVQCPHIATSRVDSEPVSKHSSLSNARPSPNREPPFPGHTPSQFNHAPCETYDVPPNSRVVPLDDSGIYNVPTNTLVTRSSLQGRTSTSTTILNAGRVSLDTPLVVETPATPDARHPCQPASEIYDVPPGKLTSSAQAPPLTTPHMMSPCRLQGDGLSPGERSQVNSILSEGADSGISESRVEEDYDVPRCDVIDEQTADDIVNNCKRYPHTPHSHAPHSTIHGAPHAPHSDRQPISPHTSHSPRISQSTHTGYGHSTRPFVKDPTPEPPSISTIPRSRPPGACSSAPKPENGPKLVPNHAHSCHDDLDARIPARQTPSPCPEDANYSTPVSKTDKEEQLELLSRLGEFAKRSCSRLMSAYRLPSSSRSTALYDLQMACVAVRKCTQDFVQHCSSCQTVAGVIGNALQLEQLLQPNARHLRAFSESLAALDAVSWRFERLSSCSSTPTSVNNTMSLSGEQYLAKMVDAAEKLPQCIDRLTKHVRREFEESAAPPPPLPPNTRHTTTPAHSETPASPVDSGSLRPQRRGRERAGTDRWIDESDYIHFSDARKHYSTEEDCELTDLSKEDEEKLKAKQGKPSNVQQYVSTPTRTPLVQMRLSTSDAPATNPSYNTVTPSHQPAKLSANAESSFVNKETNSSSSPSPFARQSNPTPASTQNTSNSSHNTSGHAHSTYQSTAVQPADQLYDLLPARLNQKLRVSFDDHSQANNGNHATTHVTNGSNNSPAETPRLSSGFEKKLRAVKSFDETPANLDSVGVASTQSAARASTHATESESAMLQHYAGQLNRALGDLRVSADRLVSETVSGGRVDKVDALRHAHRLIYLSDAVSRRVVNLHELGARLSDYTAGMSISLKSVNGAAVAEVTGDREKLLRAVENVYSIANTISTLVSENAEICSR